MKFIYLLFFSSILASCELIVINAPKREVKNINISQNNALGSIYLFKIELDSNNVPAATDILAKDNKNKFLAIEKIDFYDEVDRIGRVISNKNITKLTTDTLSKDLYRFNLELNYRKQVSFTTSRIDSSWYIIDYVGVTGIN